MIYFDPVNCYVNASTDEALFWGGNLLYKYSNYKKSH